MSGNDAREAVYVVSDGGASAPVNYHHLLSCDFRAFNRSARSIRERNDIGDVVTSSNGPEAGVWVIAETTDLPTKFARIVVTDDQGRYLIPDLPSASYSVCAPFISRSALIRWRTDVRSTVCPRRMRDGGFRLRWH